MWFTSCFSQKRSPRAPLLAPGALRMMQVFAMIGCSRLPLKGPEGVFPKMFQGKSCRKGGIVPLDCAIVKICQSHLAKRCRKKQMTAFIYNQL